MLQEVQKGEGSLRPELVPRRVDNRPSPERPHCERHTVVRASIEQDPLADKLLRLLLKAGGLEVREPQTTTPTQHSPSDHGSRHFARGPPAIVQQRRRPEPFAHPRVRPSGRALDCSEEGCTWPLTPSSHDPK